MKIIRNNIIPFKGYSAINLFGILFVKKDIVISDKTLNHESIHTAQMKELLYVPFYIWYIIEYLCKRFGRTQHEAYRAVSFEREAYNNENNLNYLKDRKHYNWFNLINKEK